MEWKAGQRASAISIFIRRAARPATEGARIAHGFCFGQRHAVLASEEWSGLFVTSLLRRWHAEGRVSGDKRNVAGRRSAQIFVRSSVTKRTIDLSLRYFGRKNSNLLPRASGLNCKLPRLDNATNSGDQTGLQRLRSHERLRSAAGCRRGNRAAARSAGEIFEHRLVGRPQPRR
jgi:hypothetical protein